MTDHDRLRDALSDIVANPPTTPNDRRAAVARRVAAGRVRRAGARATVAGTTALAIAVLTGSVSLPTPPGTSTLAGATRSLGFGGGDGNRGARESAKPRRTPPPNQKLKINVHVRPETVRPGDPVNVIIRVSDGDGQILGVRVDYGDGASDARNRPAPCPSPSSGERQATPTNRGVHFQHRYAAAGNYTITAVVRTGGCGAADERATDRTTVTVDPNAPSASPRPSGSPPPRSAPPSPRPSRSPSARPTRPPGQPGNGPELPRAIVNQVRPPDGADPSQTYVRVGGGDRDGYVSRIVVDWGDGSEPQVLSFPLDQCRITESGYPQSRRARVLAHRYATNGSYAVTVRVTSTACDGSTPQTGQATGYVRQPAPTRSPQPSPTR